MNEPLHPSTLGEILDRTAQLYRSRFLVLLGISVIPTGVVVVLACGFFLFEEWIRTGAAAKDVQVLAFVFLGGLALVALPAYLAATALASAALNHAASRLYLGESTTIRGAYKSVWRRGWRYIGLYLLQVLFIWVAPFAVWIGLVAFSAAGAALAEKAGMGSFAGGALFGLATFLILAALVGYVVWMLIELSLAFPACVVEEMKAWASIKRSFALCKGTRGRIFLLGLLAAALGWLLSMGAILILAILLYLIPGISGAQHQRTAGVLVLLIVYGSSFAVQALIRPVYGIALVLFYYDQRIRNEGFDIELLMQRAGMAQAPNPEPEGALWLPVPQGKTLAPIPEAPQAVESLETAETTSEAPGESQ